MASTRYGHRSIAVVAAFVVALTALAGCGADKYTYVANSADQAYFRIPSGWHEIDPAPIVAHFAQVDEGSFAAMQLGQDWAAAYDASAEPRPDHLIGNLTADAPVLFVSVRHLSTAAQGAVSLDVLRNLYLPVTDQVRQLVPQLLPNFPLTNFELLLDQALPVTKDGLHGVRTVYNYQYPSGAVQTFDQTFYANADSSVLYLLLTHCSFECYKANVVTLDDISTSFTVRSKA